MENIQNTTAVHKVLENAMVHHRLCCHRKYCNKTKVQHLVFHSYSSSNAFAENEIHTANGRGLGKTGKTNIQQLTFYIASHIVFNIAYNFASTTSFNIAKYIQ